MNNGCRQRSIRSTFWLESFDDNFKEFSRRSILWKPSVFHTSLAIIRYICFVLVVRGGGETGEAVALHLYNIIFRLQRLESISSTSLSSVSSILGSVPLLPSSSIFGSKIAALSSGLSLVKSSIVSLTSTMGQVAI